MTTNWQQPPGGSPPPQPNNQNPGSQGKGKRFAIVAVLLVVIAGLAAGAGLFMANRDSGTAADDARYVLTETAATEPVFEPLDAPGENPFFALDLQLAAFQEEQEEDIREQAEELLEGTEPGQEVDVPQFDVAALDEAVKTGLYGGTAENTCDPERLISFLYANPVFGRAWAIAQEIEFVEIADYIRSLDVRILAEDTNVLNHGFDPDTNAPYEIDTILEAGTAVLVDKDGDVRTRCYCGNPIKPKPPEHMPPRCVVWIEHIYVSPAGAERRENAVRDVLLTGRETTVGGAVWIEVKWGNADDQRGWVRSDNLRDHYCPPESLEWQCPGPDDVPVWANPDTTEQVGWHTGTLHTPAGNMEIFGPVEPVGGPTPVINNGFMLIHFTQANNLQNSAWVRLEDLQQDEEDCFRIPMCVDTEGPVWARAGGAILDPGGVMRVEFTGRFVTDIVTHAEVRLLEQPGVEGWISVFYTALEDADCDTDVIYECVTDPGKFGALVYQDSTGPTEIGHIYNAEVTVFDETQNGRVRIAMADPGGPIGWIDETLLTADPAKCIPHYACYETTAPAFTEFPDQGDMIGAQGPSTIGLVGLLAHGQGGDMNDYVRIDVGGPHYWIPVMNLNLLPERECEPIEVDCPTYGWPDPGRPTAPRVEELGDLRLSGDSDRLLMLDDSNFDEDSRPDRPVLTECCVSALYETPDLSTPVIGLIFPLQVTVVDTIIVDNLGVEEIWFLTDTGDYFMLGHVLFFGDCTTTSDCPDPVEILTIPERISDETREELLTQVDEPRILRPTYPGGEDCCISGAFIDIDSGIEVAGEFPRSVDVVSGPHAPAPGWYMTADGDWFHAFNVLPASACDPIDCPNPMVPGRYDRGDLSRDTEATIALASLYPGDTAECCAEGEIYSGSSFDTALGAPLTEPTSVVVIEIDGDWYRVVIQDFVVWIHVSQFLDLGDCDGEPSCTRVGQTSVDVLLEPTCCIQGRVLTVHPADATPGDFISIDPAVEGVLVQIIEDVDGGPWYEFDTDDFGTIWTTSNWIVGDSACDQDVPCPGDSLVAQAIVDDFENGPYNIYQCCVAVNVVGAGTTYKIVTLTGETMTVAGVTSYETTDGEWIIETDFVFNGDCQQECEDGQTIVTNLEDCPPPVLRCPDGQIVTTLESCPTPGFTCDDGSVVQTPSQCPPPPQTCTNSDQDSICDFEDNCDFVANEDQLDRDRDDVGDACDDCPAGDFDGDGICDRQDNCPSVGNPNQSNSDGDTIGDACDNCPFDTNGFQTDSDGDLIGDACDRPDCPQDRLLDNGQCCPTGSSADGPECFCQSGPEVRPGGTCPPPCPQERQIPGGQCCPAGTTAGSVDCFCADESLPVNGVCTKQCPNNGPRIPVNETCPVAIVGGLTLACTSDRLRGDGVCCPPGSIAWQTNLASATVWSCLEPEG